MPARLVHTSEVLCPTENGYKWQTAAHGMKHAQQQLNSVESRLISALELQHPKLSIEAGVEARANARRADELAHFVKNVKQTSESTSEVEIDGEKFTYISEFEDGPQPPRGGDSKSRASPAKSTQSAPDAEMWDKALARLEHLERLEAADEAGIAGAAPAVAAGNPASARSQKAVSFAHQSRPSDEAPAVQASQRRQRAPAAAAVTAAAAAPVSSKPSGQRIGQPTRPASAAFSGLISEHQGEQVSSATPPAPDAGRHLQQQQQQRVQPVMSRFKMQRQGLLPPDDDGY